MSKFTTTIPVAVDEVIGNLPKGSFIHPISGIRLSENRRSLVLEWEHDDLKTPYTRPVEISVAMLNGKEALPQIVSKRQKTSRVQTSAVAPKARKVAKMTP